MAYQMVSKVFGRDDVGREESLADACMKRFQSDMKKREKDEAVSKTERAGRVET